MLLLLLDCLLTTRESCFPLQKRRANDHTLYLFCFGTWKANCKVLENIVEDESCQEYSAITGNFQMQWFLPTIEVSSSDIFGDKIMIILI